MVDTNVTSLIAFSRIVSPGMVARRRGHIVNVCSVAGHEAFSDMSVYCATKHAALAFTDCTRHDLVGTPIRVTAISPGAVKTDLFTMRFGGDVSAAEEYFKGFEALLPEDIADSMAYALTRPSHVQIREIFVLPTNQSSARSIARHS